MLILCYLELPFIEEAYIDSKPFDINLTLGAAVWGPFGSVGLFGPFGFRDVQGSGA